MQPLVQLFGPHGHRLAESRRMFGRDAIIVHTAAEAADYLIRVQDLVYAGSGDYVYRLVVDTRPVVDQVVPLVISPDGSTPVTVIGRNLPDGQPVADAEVLDGFPLQSRQYTVEPSQRLTSAVGSTTTAINDNTFWWNGIDGNLIRMGTSTLTPLEEAPDLATDEPDQIVPVPVEISAAFTQQADQDTFRFTAAKDQAWIVDVSSGRFGSLADPVLIVEQVLTDANGVESFKRLASEDDGRDNPGGANLPTYSDDPSFRLQVPEDGTYRIRLRDRYTESRGDRRLNYHVSIRAPEPDFSLVLFDAFPSADGKAPPSTGAVSLRKGGSYEMMVYAWRKDGHNDAITLTAENLPAGITCSPAVIAAGQSSAMLVLTATDDASELAAPVRITGVSGAGETAKQHAAQVATLAHDALNGLPRTGRLSETLIVGIMKDEQPFSLEMGSIPQNLSQDQQVLIPVTLRRRAGFEGKVDVSFVGLPGNIDAPNFAFEPNATQTTARIFLKENAGVTASTVTLYGTSQVPYRRNPWAAERAAAKVKEAEMQVTAATEGVQGAEKAVAESEKMVTEMAAQVTALTQQVTDAETRRNQSREASAKLLGEYDTAVGQLNQARETLAKAQAGEAKSADETAQAVAALQQAAGTVEQLAVSVTKLTEQEQTLAKAVNDANAMVKQKLEEKVATEKRLEAQKAAVTTAQA
ncbi:MAG: hypothetical protein KDA85_10305, partial [Planctomycetaceae bacterium]|nr:hypothetical protein [Planctomycetaceae bacterium]